MPTNNLSGSNAIAHWKLENNGLDSIGGYDLSEFNTPSYTEADNCPGDTDGGTWSGDIENDDDEFWFVATGNLDSSFPGYDVPENGEWTKTSFSVTGWIKVETLPGGLWGIAGFWDAEGEDEFSWLIYLDSSGDINFIISVPGGGNNAATWNNGGSHISTGTWYHITATYTYDVGTPANSVLHLRGYEDGGSATNGTDDTGDIALSYNRSFTLGTHDYSATTNSFDGKMDDWIVWNTEALSDADSDKVWAGTYGAAVGVAPQAMYHYQQQSS